MSFRKIGILGGSGFVGRCLAKQLCDAGHELKVLSRRRATKRHAFSQLPDLELVEADIHDQAQLTAHLSGCDTVVNLVGILNERGTGGTGFHHAHVELTGKVIRACRENRIERLLHMSAINADATGGTSHYLRSKGLAEDNAHAAEGLRVTSYRPSVIFGSDDSFFNRFAALLRLMPGVFPLACAGARFAPVFVEDVARAMVETLQDPAHFGKRYDLCGPRNYTLQELVEYTASCTGRNRVIIPLPDFAARMQGLAFDLAGFVFPVLGIEQPFSADNYRSMQVDAVCRCNDLETLGIVPATVESIVPAYLSDKR